MSTMLAHHSLQLVWGKKEFVNTLILELSLLQSYISQVVETLTTYSGTHPYVLDHGCFFTFQVFWVKIHLN